MATKWDNVEVETERIIDTNPKVWVSAAIDDITKQNFDMALQNAQQAEVLANETDNRSMLPECYAIQIYAYYEKGDRVKAEKIKNAHFDNELRNFLFTKPDYIVVFKWHNNAMWMPVWQDMVKSWIDNCHFANMEKYADLIEDNYLAAYATERFIIEATINDACTCMKKLYQGGYNLSDVFDKERNNLIMIALANKSKKISNFLLDKNINDINAKNKRQETPLMLAVFSDMDVSIVKILLDKGARVNDRNENRVTALMVSHKATITELLIKAGANINDKDDQGCTALIIASDHGFSDVVKVLIEFQADIHVKAANGITALTNAVANGDFDSVHALVSAGADVNIKNPDGITALMLAVMKNDERIVDALLKAKADVDCETFEGLDALSLSFSSNASSKITKALLEAGANPNKLYNGKTLLHSIASGCHWKDPGYSDWKLLLASAKIDVNLKDNYGKTALEYSVDHSWVVSDELDMARALVEKGATVTPSVSRIMFRRGINKDKLYNNKPSNIVTSLSNKKDANLLANKVFFSALRTLDKFFK